MAKKYYNIGDLEALLESRFDENGVSNGTTCVSSLSTIGVEILDEDTKERQNYYTITGAWFNDEWDELTLTVEKKVNE